MPEKNLVKQETDRILTKKTTFTALKIEIKTKNRKKIF